VDRSGDVAACVLEQGVQVASGGGDRVRGVVGVGVAVGVAVDAVGLPGEGGPFVTLNCIGPAQQPKALTPDCTTGARERPWSDSIAPMAARIGQGTA
jgi:hypothetical protein